MKNRMAEDGLPTDLSAALSGDVSGDVSGEALAKTEALAKMEAIRAKGEAPRAKAGA